MLGKVENLLNMKLYKTDSLKEWKQRNLDFSCLQLKYWKYWLQYIVSTSEIGEKEKTIMTDSLKNLVY